MDGPARVIVNEDGTSVADVNSNNALKVSPSPPVPPTGTTEFALAQDEAELSVSTTPKETLSSIIANGVTLKVQMLCAGAAGDPSERGSKVEFYWREGSPATDHLIDRIYIVGQTLCFNLPDSSITRDGTSMVGNGTNTRFVIKRERISNSSQEIDAVARGYLET